MQLIDMKEIKGKITLKSGLHIGAGDMEMQIGGTDNPVVKHPHTLEPYIPGSSIKGKVRALLELKSGLMFKTGGEPLQPRHLNGLDEQQIRQAEIILKIFGSSGADSEELARLGPTRASFADCPLNDQWRKEAVSKRLSLTEVKSENSINRIQGTAQNPRFTERVPANAVFDFSISVKIFQHDEEELFDVLLQGLKLLEMDALGGSGSRGYGKVLLDFEDEALLRRFASITLFDMGGK
ncbi:type III-A CRISPR-associated RAMP protein Csm3 [Desulfoferrobacter suflitae]|uniref:type III-A CRISPR-associated RAMP protein Csm3 n=1 Tax=Desulfoferrobacter suflitae TaxID=2865782 RepID=UPI002164E6A7|nr:type III-A CRISPR-associated RAMP protein Csm3 [Desulfoferrobacter suflitae]MCK8603005.1 type III-A CRISPR-associated RAMP protein Csm3 [Desulfoferrobacter suflitae]